MDGLLVIDKPAGPSSHDVVARVRRALGERRIGHTGTLDPAATGVLPLVLGRATRLARFLSASDKSYEAVVRLGVATDTYDAEGAPAGPSYQGALPSREAIDRALDAFRGTFVQQPPAYSAKKIDGHRSYKIARATARQSASAVSSLPAHPAVPALPALPRPVNVTAYSIVLMSVEGDRVTLEVSCSAGFYVRALGHDLGAQLGVGAHLLALRRTRSGDATLADALGLEAIEREPALAARAIVPLARMLPRLSSVTLTSEGVRRAAQGRELGPADTEKGLRPLGASVAEKGSEPFFVRLLDPAGDLVAIGEPAGASGLLHPAVVLV
jgi:tRNA pseudouridine55 synthase